MPATECESGEWSGEKCESTEGEYKISFVPPYLRGTANALNSNYGLLQGMTVCAHCYNFLLSWCADVPEEAKYMEFHD